ncbi:MAG: NAD-dependent formate dehydrogenase [Thermoplasmata archaeon]|nr:NAD-dependent formate dehydrogenase [Thermoplasmata archaeon]MCI4359651.1 NAD-dependent formate dehydrogenase [Thermoplasmata archaeon]
MKVVMVLYPGGAAAKENPKILGAAENALGLRPMIESAGHELVALTDKERDLDRELPGTDVLVTTPFWPAYVTRARIAAAPKLKLILTAGVGSDHIDLAAAAERGITVAEITGSNVVSVAEHAVMQILALVRDYLPAYRQVVDGKWDIAAAVTRSHDLEGKVVGIVGAGRIGQRTAIRLKGFDVQVLYYDFRRLTTAEEYTLGIRYAPLDDLLRRCDVITIHCPLTPETDGLFGRERLAAMKRGAYIVNTARGKIVDTQALVEAMGSGHLAGYAGDVWYPQPAPPDHPWRSMPHHALTVHVSGTTLEAQQRYSDGIRDCLTRFFAGRTLDRDYLIVDGGKVVSPSYSYAFGK